jgi:hypothetical protein
MSRAEHAIPHHSFERPTFDLEHAACFPARSNAYQQSFVRLRTSSIRQITTSLSANTRIDLRGATVAGPAENDLSRARRLLMPRLSQCFAVGSNREAISGGATVRPAGIQVDAAGGSAVRRSIAPDRFCMSL